MALGVQLTAGHSVVLKSRFRGDLPPMPENTGEDKETKLSCFLELRLVVEDKLNISFKV
jgi:hypothetical protein